jgi:hypothetical protein
VARLNILSLLVVEEAVEPATEQQAVEAQAAILQGLQQLILEHMPLR